jgi:hypothetical protein
MTAEVVMNPIHVDASRQEREQSSDADDQMKAADRGVRSFCGLDLTRTTPRSIMRWS